MALRPEDLKTLQLAFGEHDQPELRVTSMVAAVIEAAAACADAMCDVGIHLADRWNQSAELLDRVLAGVTSLRDSAEAHAGAIGQAFSEARSVMEELGESADQSREGLEEQHPEATRKMEALVTALSGRTTTAQAQADKALDEWAQTLAGQQDELDQVVGAAQEASAGLDAVMAAARAATAEGVATLNQRLQTMGDTAPVHLDFADQQVVGPALDRWAGGVDDLPHQVEQRVTALLAELTPPVAEAGVLLAQGATAVQELARGVSTRAAPAVRDLGERRGRVAAGEETLVQARAPFDEIVTACRVTAEEIGEPW